MEKLGVLLVDVPEPRKMYSLWMPKMNLQEEVE